VLPGVRKQLHGMVTAWGPRWERLRDVEFFFEEPNRVPDEWTILDHKSGTRYYAREHPLTDPSEVIPLECRKVISLRSRSHFTRGEWTTFSKPLPGDEGLTSYFYARPGFELTLWVDADDFVFGALARSSEGGDVEESGFRVTPVIDPIRLHSLLEGR
jgi:hypothetical protein